MIRIFIFSLVVNLVRSQNAIPINKRIDCHPDPGATADNCVARGCYSEGSDWSAAMNNPTCYFPPNTGYIAETSLDQNPVTLKKNPSSIACPFGQDFQELTFKVDEIGSAVKVTIFPKGTTRYRPPIPVNSLPNIISSDKFSVVKTNDSIFSFSVQRQSSQAKIWDTSIGGLLFADKFLQIATYLPSTNIYGFGEHIHINLKHDMTRYNTWGLTSNGGLGDTKLNTNLYGVHPFYMGIEDDGKAHGVFFFNSNAAEVTTAPAPHLIYRTIGGQFEIFYFPGPTPEQVIQQYQQVIGTPFLPGYWALGFHICRYGYNSTEAVKTVVDRNRAAGVPLDGIWTDIDAMSVYRDFTLGTYWEDYRNFTRYLHSLDIKVVMMFSPCVEADYDVFARAIAQNISFISWPRADMVPQSVEDQYPMCKGTNIMLASMWPPKHVAYPDFLDPTNKTTEWWISEFSRYLQLAPIDGMWIDMNEPAVFGTTFYKESEKGERSKGANPALSCPEDGPDAEWDSPPYLTAGGYWGGHLASNSLCMCASTARGNHRFYDTKNLLGLSESMATFQAQKHAIGKRGVILSRNTFPSSGSYVAHWTGDNHATWDDLRYSIIQIQEFNMFGVASVGADVCGFHDNYPVSNASREQLCLRWQQLASFYTFARNHNLNSDPDHDPAVWPAVAAATRKAFLWRYRHLPYLYSLHFSATLHGGTVVRPVLFEFPNDLDTHNISFQFMWGEALMAMPNATSVNGYLPPDATWYSLYDYFYGTKMEVGWQNFEAPTTYNPPSFVRGGYILPRQAPAVTTTQSRMNEMELLIALDPYNSAKGELFWDDGESVYDDINSYNYYHSLYQFSTTAQTAILNITMAKQTTSLPLQPLNNIEIFGYPYNPNLKSATLNGSPVVINTQTSTYSPFSQILNITTSGLVNLNSGGPTWILSWQNN